MSMYDPLTRYLQSQPPTTSSVNLSFQQIERILQSDLPPSARKHRPWWANDTTHSHAVWLKAGWQTQEVDMASERVTFVRRGSPAPEDPRKEVPATTRAQTATNGPLGHVLLLIPCCGEKHGTGPAPKTAPACLAEQLSGSSRDLLDEGRRLAFSRRGASLDFDSPLLPAVTWYTGRPYSVPGFLESLGKALDRGLQCLVVSGGYGLVLLEEPIHKYEAQMSKTLTVWKDRLPRILPDYVTRNGIRRVFGALSTHYYDAVRPGRWGAVEAETWWYVPRFRPGVDAGAAMRAVPEAVGRAVIDLVDSDFAPGPRWRRG